MATSLFVTSATAPSFYIQDDVGDVLPSAGGAFVPFVDADLATYLFAPTRIGTANPRWDLDFSAITIAAGNYLAIVYSSTSPAVTDVPFVVLAFAWDGTDIILAESIAQTTQLDSAILARLPPGETEIAAAGAAAKTLDDIATGGSVLGVVAAAGSLGIGSSQSGSFVDTQILDGAWVNRAVGNVFDLWLRFDGSPAWEAVSQTIIVELDRRTNDGLAANAWDFVVQGWVQVHYFPVQDGQQVAEITLPEPVARFTRTAGQDGPDGNVPIDGSSYIQFTSANASNNRDIIIQYAQTQYIESGSGAITPQQYAQAVDNLLSKEHGPNDWQGNRVWTTVVNQVIGNDIYLTDSPSNASSDALIGVYFKSTTSTGAIVIDKVVDYKAPGDVAGDPVYGIVTLTNTPDASLAQGDEAVLLFLSVETSNISQFALSKFSADDSGETTPVAGSIAQLSQADTTALSTEANATTNKDEILTRGGTGPWTTGSGGGGTGTETRDLEPAQFIYELTSRGDKVAYSPDVLRMIPGESKVIGFNCNVPFVLPHGSVLATMTDPVIDPPAGSEVTAVKTGVDATIAKATVQASLTAIVGTEVWVEVDVTNSLDASVSTLVGKVVVVAKHP